MQLGLEMYGRYRGDMGEIWGDVGEAWRSGGEWSISMAPSRRSTWVRGRVTGRVTARARARARAKG